jgi:hypothetical protein
MNIKQLDKRTYNKAVTVWEDPKNRLESQWGTITYQEWCIKESRRMNNNGGDTLVCREPKGLVAICRP